MPSMHATMTATIYSWLPMNFIKLLHLLIAFSLLSQSLMAATSMPSEHNSAAVEISQSNETDTSHSHQEQDQQCHTHGHCHHLHYAHTAWPWGDATHLLSAFNIVYIKQPILTPNQNLYRPPKV